MAAPPTQDEIAEEKRILRQETEKHCDFLDRLFKSLQSSQDGNKKLEAEVAACKEQAARDAEKQRELENQIAKLEQDLKDKQAEMERKLAEAAQASGDAQSALQEQMAKMKADYEAQIAALEGKVQQLSDELASVKQQLADKIHEFENTVALKDDIIADLQRKVAGAEATVKGILFLRENVDAFHLAQNIIREPVAALMLPNGCTLVADTISGLLMFSPHSELIQQLQSTEWKWPQGLVIDVDGNEILVSLMRRQTDESYKRVVQHFKLVPDHMHLYQILKEDRYIMGPEEAELHTHVAKEKLARASNGDLYLSVADLLSSALYKLSKESGSQWITLSKRQGQHFADLAVWGQRGPITEVLIVEAKMGYLHKFSIRGQDIAARQTLAVVEKPHCIAVDDEGTLFVQDIISGKVHQINAHMEISKDVCLVDDSVFSITANHGYLGVAVRQEKTVKIFRYSEKFIKAVSSTADDGRGALSQIQAAAPTVH